MDTKISRKQLYDPYRGEFVYDIIPTQTIKRSRSLAAGVGTYGNLATYSIGSGSVGLMTYLHISQDPGVRGKVAAVIGICDRYGTMDKISITGGTVFAGRPYYLVQGERKAPVHTVFGTFKVTKSNAATLGTIHASWEMITVTGVPGREGTVTRY